MSVEVRDRLVVLIEKATNGHIAAQGLDGTVSLSAMGLDSLAHLRLIDAIELEYGIETDLNVDGRRLDTVDEITAHLSSAAR